MNGAGELYLGYRFDHLDVFEYEAESQKGILVELYHMKTSDDAYGLLSLDWGGEAMNLAADSPDEAGGRLPWPRALYGQGLLRLWTQNIYARVMATQETPESREAVLSIGRAIVQGRKNSPAPALSERLKDQISPGWILQKAKLSFFRTHLVLNSLYYLSHENILGLDLKCEALKGVYEKSDSQEGKLRTQIILVSYPDGKKAKQALSRFHGAYLVDIPFSPETGRSGEKRGVFSVEDGWMGYGLNDASIAFVFESPDENTVRAILDQMHANIN
jgi:hypothetical protein